MQPHRRSLSPAREERSSLRLLLTLSAALPLGCLLALPPAPAEAQEEEESLDDYYGDDEGGGEEEPPDGDEGGSEEEGSGGGSAEGGHGAHPEGEGSGRTWAVIPVGLGSLPSLAQGVADRVRSLLNDDGEHVLSPSTLLERGEAAYGEVPPAADEALVGRISSGDAQFEESIRARQYEDVVALGGQLLDSVEAQIINVNRSEEATASLINVCGRLYYAHSRLRNREEADAVIRRCLHMVPGGLEFPRRGHPSAVRRAFSRASHDMLVETLRVVAPQPAPGCVFRVNGKAVGAPPRAELSVVAGEYLVQVECGTERGRVHRVTVGAPAGGGEEGAEGADLYSEGPAEPTQVDISRTEIILQSNRELVAVYSSPADLERAPEDVTVLARTLSATHVLAILETQHTVWINAFVIPEGGSASAARSAEVTNMEDPAVIARALNVALGRSSVAGEVGTEDRGGGDGGLIAGWVLAGVGGATLVASLVSLILVLQEGGFTEHPVTFVLRENDADLELVSLGLLGGGIALTAVGVALVAAFSGGDAQRPIESAALPSAIPRLNFGCTGHGCAGQARWRF